ncbi:MAG: NUDIX hydrolase [Burkholderiales bacterium]|nr:NUDIX hydrolase [Burkholderiales bacterium]
MIWKPNTTVAAVLELDGKFLLVEENTSQGDLFNQPAGHLEPGESLVEGAIREALEESAYTFEPKTLIGIYQWRTQNTTYLRFAFTGPILSHDPQRKLDTGIIRAIWLSPDEIRAEKNRHRSPMVCQCIEDYLDGRRYPLDIITHWEDA